MQATLKFSNVVQNSLLSEQRLEHAEIVDTFECELS